MSKRRINKQQSSRIEKIQQAYQLNKETLSDSLADGLVLSRFSKHVEIEDQEGRRIRCSIRPNLEILVAGDRIIWQPEGLDHGVVVSLYPRASILARPTAKGLKKPVAANITQMIIVVAPKPEISWPLLDSYLIIAETLKLHAVILLNKVDLPCEDIKNQLNIDYQKLNYSILLLSQTQPNSFSALKQALNHQVSVFVGQSGVGKSSLIASILPHEHDITTGDISVVSELGKHTTSNSRYYHLPSGGALIDSPGVREFSLWDIEPNIITQGYKEFAPHIAGCKFRNCTHENTPHCGLINALQDGKISQNRYDNFIKLRTQYSKSKY